MKFFGSGWILIHLLRVESDFQIDCLLLDDLSQSDGNSNRHPTNMDTEALSALLRMLIRPNTMPLLLLQRKMRKM